MTLRKAVLCSIAGIAWGGLANVLGRQFELGDIIGAATYISPLIGLAVGYVMQQRFEESSVAVRPLVSLVTLYFASTLFGVVVGYQAWFQTPPARRMFENFWEGLASIWYGCTVLVLLLWPLTYLTQWAIGRTSWHRNTAAS